MIRFSILLAALILGFSASSAQSVMNVPEAQDWGTIRLPKELYVEAEVPIKNDAKSGILKILEVKPGCGCTKTDPDKTELQPGETAKVKIRLNLTSSQGGPQVKTVTIRALHNVDTIVKIVYLKVNLERVLTIGPSTFVSFNDAMVGAESVSIVTIENPSALPVTVNKLTVDGDIKSDLEDGSVIAPHSKKEVKISLTPTKPGQIYGSVKFTASGNGADEEFLLPAYGTVTKVASK